MPTRRSVRFGRFDGKDRVSQARETRRVAAGARADIEHPTRNRRDQMDHGTNCRVSSTIGDMVPSGAVMPVHLGAIKYRRETGRAAAHFAGIGRRAGGCLG
jgi:hypothetical protein